ncbi:sigma-70 family RNA polymerase sigma factor [Saccharomonospora azurea]|uniref:sigma-70 family RNA polymerase sigma factor n=1 Tax=Saccharomonospora azurea TaxID=40988 RepID=UPI00331EDCC2
MSIAADYQPPSDAEIIAAVRAGEVDRYSVLYERHNRSAKHLAWKLAESDAEADDIVSEAFVSVLDAIRSGHGPRDSFRPYLLKTVRHAAYARTRKNKRLQFAEDVEEAGGEAAAPVTEPVFDGIERSLIARAFYRLPERWQTVLWHTVVEEERPSAVAPLLGLSANAVSALAHRAREGLRQEYLQAHVQETTEPQCRAVASKLGEWTRGALSRRERAQIDAHLDRCEECSALAAELADVNSTLKTLLPFLVLGGSAAAYFGWSATAAAPSAVAATTGNSVSGGGTSRNTVTMAAAGAGVFALVAIGLAAGGQEGPAEAGAPPQGGAAPTEAAPAVPSPMPPFGSRDGGAVPSDSSPQPSPEITAPSTSDAPAAPRDDVADEGAPLTTQPPTAEPRPVMSALPPPGGVAIEAGGDTTDVEVTVTNDGTAEAADVTLTLELPDGVRAVDRTAAAGGGGGALSSTAVVDCPAGERVVTCRTSRALPPGGSAVMRVRLQADHDAAAGVVSGVIRVQGADAVQFTVPVTVKTPPDVAHLAASQVGRTRLVKVTVRNDGPVARPASVVLDVPARVSRLMSPLDCVEGGPLRCDVVRALQPGEETCVWLVVPSRWLTGWDGEQVTVTATVGGDSVTQTVPMRWLLGDLSVPEGASEVVDG